MTANIKPWKTPNATPYVCCNHCHYVWAFVISPNHCPNCCSHHLSNAYDPAKDPNRATSYDSIFLADNEWGSDLMEEVADHWFNHNPDCHFVYIYEHAGWSLMFHHNKMNGKRECVGSANDLAQFRSNRPLPTHSSTIHQRRPVQDPDIQEITTLKQYTYPCPTSPCPNRPNLQT